ncbi:hypothetical protein GCM10008025_21160 [Ornithinibacillus halotolerans]|uniref:N-acetyltransferase domain-containing protein n=1 Tax=Ornithinibacillus halotolerans TaxID=1274357 RepID=A0A916RZW9_9BACI|nr:hypothetical protein GCM10008025_21160 [Ornithinibacillus halotolerans]
MPFNNYSTLDEISWYKSIFEKKTGIRWVITLKGKGRVICSCGFLNIVLQDGRSEVGYELSKEYWGKGIASEAFEAVIQFGFEQLNLQRVQALIEPPNISSQKLLERKGFIKEGLF